jgi:hypothetical protein
MFSHGALMLSLGSLVVVGEDAFVMAFLLLLSLPSSNCGFIEAISMFV